MNISELSNEHPLHVLKTNEAVLMPVERGKLWNALRTLTIAIIAGIIVLSFLVSSNVFFDLGWYPVFLLVALALITIPVKHVDVPSPVEIHFFQDYLVFYHPKRFYNKRCTRRLIEKIRYSDITLCKYRVRYNKLVIFGAVERTWYKYGKDGTLPTTPNYHELESDSMMYIRARCAPEVDFVKEIEEHSPIKVVLEP